MSLTIQEDEPLEIINDIGEFITETTLTEDEKDNNKAIIESLPEEFQLSSNERTTLKMSNILKYTAYTSYVVFVSNLFSSIFRRAQLEGQLFGVGGPAMRYTAILDEIGFDGTFKDSKELRFVNDVLRQKMTLGELKTRTRNEINMLQHDLREERTYMRRMANNVAMSHLTSAIIFLSRESYILIKYDYSMWKMINIMISSFLLLPLSTLSGLMIHGNIDLHIALRTLLRFGSYMDVTKKKDFIKKVMFNTPIMGRFFNPKITVTSDIDPLRFIGETHFMTLESSFNINANGPASGEYNYCGPGTRLDLRDIPGTKDEYGLPVSRKWSQPLNLLDVGCKFHDYSYKSDGDNGFTEESQILGDVALIQYIDVLLNKNKIGFLEKMDAELVKVIFEFKLEFTHGITFEDAVKKIKKEALEKDIENIRLKNMEKLRQRIAKIKDIDMIKIKSMPDFGTSSIYDTPDIYQVSAIPEVPTDSIYNVPAIFKQQIKPIDTSSIYDMPNIYVETPILKKSNIYDQPTIYNNDIVPITKDTSSIFDMPKQMMDTSSILDDPTYKEFLDNEQPPPRQPPIPPRPPIIQTDPISQPSKPYDIYEPTIEIQMEKPRTYPTLKEMEKARKQLFFVDEDKAKRNKEFNKLVKLINKTKKKFLNQKFFIPLFI
jgi:hypothetical protein